MANGGLAAIGVFRKHRSANAIQSKYPTIVRTAEEIEADELAAAGSQMVVDEGSSSESEVEESKKSAKKKNYTIDDIMSMDKSLQITKKQKKDAV
jgi:hypothetical protein